MGTYFSQPEVMFAAGSLVFAGFMFYNYGFLMSGYSPRGPSIANDLPGESYNRMLDYNQKNLEDSVFGGSAIRYTTDNRNMYTVDRF